jgi:hypothetical protein
VSCKQRTLQWTKTSDDYCSILTFKLSPGNQNPIMVIAWALGNIDFADFLFSSITIYNQIITVVI